MKQKIFTLFLALIASVGTIFADAVKIGDLYYNLYEENKTAELTCPPYSETYRYKGDVVIPATIYHGASYRVTGVERGAFGDSWEVTSIFVPSSVTSIGEAAFFAGKDISDGFAQTGSRLLAINVDVENPKFASIDGVLFDKSLKTLIQYPLGRAGAYIIPSTVDSIGTLSFYSCPYITEVTIPNNVRIIGDRAFALSRVSKLNMMEGLQYIEEGAFYLCPNLKSITIPNSVTYISGYAFGGSFNLNNTLIGSGVNMLYEGTFSFDVALAQSITCYATKKITLDKDAIIFWEVQKENGDYVDAEPADITNNHLTVYVPMNLVNDYKADSAWGKFTILPISAMETDVTDTRVTPDATTVEITWPAVSGAASYELVIKDKTGNVVCTLIFNAQGQLTSIAFNAPARDDAPQKAQSAGFSFTVTGLETGTAYDLTITAKNENGQEVDKKNITFHTSWPTALEDIHVDSSKTVKIIHDGQILILRGVKTYTVQGQEVR